MTPRNLKLLYILTLGLLCLYVTTGPAVAVSAVPSAPQFFNASANPFANFVPLPGGGYSNLYWTGTYFNGISNNSIFPESNLYLFTVVHCEGPAETSCSSHMSFDFDVVGSGSLWVSLIGSSTDAGAYGDLSFSGITEPWHIDNGNLAMNAIMLQVGTGHYSGDFTIASLAAGTYLDLPITFEADAGVPEPVSALLLMGGFAVVEFLRRKSRR